MPKIGIEFNFLFFTAALHSDFTKFPVPFGKSVFLHSVEIPVRQFVIQIDTGLLFTYIRYAYLHQQWLFFQFIEWCISTDIRSFNRVLAHQFLVLPFLFPATELCHILIESCYEIHSHRLFATWCRGQYGIASYFFGRNPMDSCLLCLTMCQKSTDIKENIGFFSGRIRIAMHTHSGCRGQFHSNLIFIQFNFVVSRFHNFRIMRVGWLISIHSFMPCDFSGSRHHRNTCKLPTMHMTKAAYLFRIIQITGIPTSLRLCIRTQTDHPKRTGSRREKEPSWFVSINLGTYIVDRSHLLLHRKQT